ncbi:Uncharacterised protein [Metamycoplasma alkalescens]|nr:Uncharacterised protein [Metamycoplasma alkalescens]
MDLNQKNNLTNKEFQNQAKMYMQKTKEILLAIAKKEGIKDSEINPLLK